MYNVSVSISPPVNVNLEVGISAPATGGASVRNSTGSYTKSLAPGELFTLPSSVLYESDGSTIVTSIPATESHTLQGVTVVDGGGTVNLEDGDSYTAKTILKIFFNVADLSVTLTADVDSAGNFISDSQDGSSGTISYEIDTGSGFGSVSLPFTLNVGDDLRITRTVTTGTGFVRLTT